MVQYSADASLQRWGANFKGVDEAAAHVARKYAEAEEEARKFQGAFGKIATQGETELPASNRLVAEVQSVHNMAQRAHSADEWRRVAADAATLHTTYKRDHDADESRLYAPRKSRAAEKRADLGAAEQDN